MVRTFSGVKVGGGAQLMWWPRGLQRSNGTITIQTRAAGQTAVTTLRLFGGQLRSSDVQKSSATQGIYLCHVSIIHRGIT